MDELDLLKKNWKEQDTNLPKLSYNEIYGLIHKKSSSVVKWILIICIIEFVFWSGLNLLIPDSYLEIYEKLHLKTFLLVTQVLHYIVVFVFIYYFYINYKSICVSDNTNMLMKKIIKTRKTVNYYVYYNLALIFLISIIVNVIMFSDLDILADIIHTQENLEKGNFLTILIISQIITLLLMMGLMWLYYRIIYGILLRKLKRNYKELASLT